MALITAAQAREYIPGQSGTASDTEIEALILRADDVLARWCGYEPVTAGGSATLEDVAYTEYLDEDAVDGAILRLPYYPIVSVTTVHDDPDRDYEATDLVDSGDYDTDARRGWLILRPDSTHGAWSRSIRAIKVVWTAGYATVPPAIQQATALLVSHWFRLRKEAGRQSISVGNGNASLRDETIPASVRQLMAPFRLRGVLVG